MSFKDDIVEALRSVKRDLSKENDPAQGQESGQPEQLASDTPSEVIPASRGNSLPPQQEEPDAQDYLQSNAAGGEADLGSGDPPRGNDGGETPRSDVEGDSTPFGRYDAGEALISGGNGNGNYGGGQAYIDFEDSDVYDDSKTIISKNTIIRGALQTDDSVRLLGQVMGDIECRSNIVVAGKVRGNTTASNAYIYDAQVDGDVRCDDVITVSADAWVLGNIRAQQAEIDGKVKGNMEIRHMVSIGAQSSILGDISTDELEIKRGAFINGQIMMYSPSRDVMDRFDRFDD